MTNLNPKAATPNMLDEALNLASLGYRIVPIKPGEKYPALKAWQDHASTDPEIITNWFTGLYQGHGIGIAPGPYADKHLFVLDIDEHGISGSETLYDLEDTYGNLPATVTTLTGNGGRHIYLLSPFEIRNDQAGRLGPGIDVRGAGGQVLAPPTVHPNGRPYHWEAGYSPDEIDPADAPRWLLALLAPKLAPQPATARSSTVWDELDDSPAARYNADTTWPQLLQADGWTHDYTDKNGEQHWTRPGKTGGTSATVNWQGKDILKVFTSSIPWLPEGAYTRFGYTACRHHNGDRSTFARTLTKTPTTTLTAVEPSEPWPDPIPLTTINTTPQFPIHTLPDDARQHVQQTADNIQVAIDLPAALYLGALATIRLGKTHINYPRQNWRQPTNLYIAVALPPSAGKTPAKNAIFKPIENIELQNINTNRPERLRQESQRNILETRRKKLQEQLADPKPKDLQTTGNLQDDLDYTINDLANITIPATGQIFVDDTTTEALGEALKDTGGNMAIITAEGGIFDRIAGLYNDGKSNMDLYLEGWSGGTYKVNRIRREPIHIPSANITITCTVQPTTLDQIGLNQEMQGRGLIARFLLTEPDNNVGTRNRTIHTATNPDIAADYETHINHTHNQPQTELYLDGQPSDIYANWDQQLENQLQPGQPLEHLAEWIGKLRASTIRIAALLHHAWRRPGDTIETDTINKAIEIGNYYLAHAQKIADRWGANPTIKDAKHIHEWLTRNRIETFTIRDLYSANRRRFPTVELTREPLILLVERGWIRPLFDGPIITGQRGKESQKFQTHPFIHNPTAITVDKSVRTVDNQLDHDKVARHARTPPRAREENSTMRNTNIGSFNQLPTTYIDSSLTHTPPCAHETQLEQSTINDLEIPNLI